MFSRQHIMAVDKYLETVYLTVKVVVKSTIYNVSQDRVLIVASQTIRRAWVAWVQTIKSIPAGAFQSAHCAVSFIPCRSAATLPLPPSICCLAEPAPTYETMTTAPALGKAWTVLVKMVKNICYTWSNSARRSGSGLDRFPASRSKWVGETD